MDRTDYQILNLLQADSRTTLKTIGDRVGLTAPAVSERIRRIKQYGDSQTSVELGACFEQKDVPLPK